MAKLMHEPPRGNHSYKSHERDYERAERLNEQCLHHVMILEARSKETERIASGISKRCSENA